MSLEKTQRIDLVGAEALGVSLGAFLKRRALARPHLLAVVRFNAAHALTFDIEGLRVCEAGVDWTTSDPTD